MSVEPRFEQTAIRTDLGAIFVSLELSRSVWLITSLSPGAGETMSKHSVRGGDVAGLLTRFAQLQEKACARTGQMFPIIAIQEAGLDGFWIHRVLESEGIESHVVDPASIAVSRRCRRAKTDKIDGEALVRTLLAYKRGEPRVCAMVRAPTPDAEDRRRISRERKTLTAERVQHVNRIKGLLFAQGIGDYEPLHRDRRTRLDALATGDGRPLPMHLKAQISRELDRLELLLEQIKAVETERDHLLACAEEAVGAATRATASPERHRSGSRRCSVVGGPVPHLRQSPAGGRLCGPRPDALEEWIGGSRARRIESRQPAPAHHHDPARLAVAAPSARIGAEPVVPGAGPAQRRAPQETDDRGAGPQAADRAVEVCDSRSDHRGRCDEACVRHGTTGWICFAGP